MSGLVKIVVFEKGWVILSANVKGNGACSPTNDCWRQKTTVPVLSYGVVCVIVSLAILVELTPTCDRQTDRRTDGRTDRQTHDDGKDRASIASRG